MYDADAGFCIAGAYSGQPRPRKWTAYYILEADPAAADLEERLTRRPSTVAALLGRLTGAH